MTARGRRAEGEDEPAEAVPAAVGMRTAMTPAPAPTLAYASPAAARGYDPDDHDCAVASVISGLLFFFAPFVTGIISLTFAASVLLHARRVRALDIVLALAGGLLGLLNLGFWATFLFRELLG
jgi:hypothetical protein